METLYAHLNEIILLIMTSAIGVGIAYLKKAVENSQFKESLTATLEAIETMSKDAISNVSEMTREALKDGKITPKERAAIKEAAKREFNTVISPTMTKRLNVHMDDADKFITAKINTAVEEAMQSATK